MLYEVITISDNDFITDIQRRQAGAAGTTARQESDVPRIKSGVYNGFSSGSPIMRNNFV